MFRSFLSFEGVEGVGKTTQLKLCADYLRRRGHPCLTTREPGGTQVGEAIRNLLLDPKTAGVCNEAEFLLFSASRAQHLHEVILPALEKGQIVLCDRFLDASVAYQGGARGLGEQKAFDTSLAMFGHCLPWKTFWLDLDPKEALRRAHGRLGEVDRFELEELSFHEKVREGYEWVRERHPERVLRISAEGTPEEVFERFVPYLEQLITLQRSQI